MPPTPAMPKPMPRSAAALRAYPNPYSALDAAGMPCGFTRYDPEHGNPGEVHHVGASLAPVALSAPRDQMKGETRPSKFTFVTHYAAAPTILPHTDYFVRRFRDADLICADETTARICGVPWVTPAEALKVARDKAIEEWTITYGAPPPVATWPELVLEGIDPGPSVSVGPTDPPPTRAFQLVIDSLSWMGDVSRLVRVALQAYGSPEAAADGLQALQTIYLPHTVRALARVGVLVLEGIEPRPIAEILTALAKVVATDPEAIMLVSARVRPLIGQIAAAYTKADAAQKAAAGGDAALSALLGTAGGAPIALNSNGPTATPTSPIKGAKKSGGDA